MRLADSADAADAADNIMTITTKTDEPLLYEKESYILRGICFKIYNELGPGHKESVYVSALKQEFEENKVLYENEKVIIVKRKGIKLGVYRLDFVLWDKIILEIKAQEFVPRVQIQTLQSYLSGSKYKLGFLVNFGSEHLVIIRKIHDKAKRKLSA